jgi:hypothetical protein
MQGGDYPVSEAGYPKEYIDSLELKNFTDAHAWFI